MTDARAVLARCDALARCSEEQGRLTRRFATPALAQARDLVAGWMREAGLEIRLDPIGNVLGRRPGAARVLLLGSHLDTVRDAGRYDGALGVLIALACAERLPGARLEVVGFADEEGARYGTGFVGSAVLAGTFDPAWLARTDADGIALADAIRAWGGDPEALDAGRRAPDDLLGYIEVHIEQGPVLERLDQPIGVVTAITGQTRARVTFTGRAAHVGTTPMDARRDALAAAAEWITAVETTARDADGLVATVGEIAAEPGASNVIPGRVVVSLDVRHASDQPRTAAAAALREAAMAVGAARGIGVEWEEIQANAAVPCAPGLTERLRAAAGSGVPALPSGAGHDAVMMAAVTPVAMLFVRCAGGVSHHPDEAVRAADVDAAIEATVRFVAEVAG